MKILLIIPAYNEEENILNTINNIKQCSNEIEYVVVNDGSTDNTLKILQENNINHINLVHNLGIGGAVQSGYKYAYANNYDIAIQFDGDGQHDANFIQTICEPVIANQADICIGSRYLDKTTSEFKSTIMRRFGKNIISAMIKLFWHKKITDPTSGFRAANKTVIEIFAKDYPSDYPEPESIVTLLRSGLKVVEKPVNMKERKGGKSFVSPGTSIIYMLKVSLAIVLDSIRVKDRRK